MEFIHQQLKLTGGAYYGESKVETFCTARHGERSRVGARHGGSRECGHP